MYVLSILFQAKSKKIFRSNVSRKCPSNVIVLLEEKSHTVGMEQLLKRLESLGVADEILDMIRTTDDRQTALLLLMDDDRHEYVD